MNVPTPIKKKSASNAGMKEMLSGLAPALDLLDHFDGVAVGGIEADDSHLGYAERVDVIQIDVDGRVDGCLELPLSLTLCPGLSGRIAWFRSLV